MQKILFIAALLFGYSSTYAQLYIAPGDSISVLPGTLFTLQEDLINNGKIYNSGVLTLNGTVMQNISGSGNTDNLTADNDAQLQSNCTINNTLHLNATKIFSLGNFHLINNGNITGPGLLNGSDNAMLSLSGNNSSIQFDQSNNATSNALKTFVINNSNAIIQNKLYVYDAMLPLSGTITLNDELVLRSNSSRTARVGVVGSSFVYGSSGKFVIERYIPGRRAWRLLTAPVTAANNLTISDAWQDGKPRVVNINIISNPEPGYGTHVTFGLPATNGYDQGINGNTSIRYLTAAGWNGVPTATNDGSVANSGIITDQPGYMLFVRGDRGTLLSQATGAVTSPTVLRPKGKINTGVLNQPLGIAFTNAGSAFRVVGNPYPSAVNFHQVVTNAVNTAAGFSDAFYLWDPNITGSNGVGGFVGLTYNAAASIAAGKPVYDRSVTSGIDNSGDIQSGAAFVIDYAGAATALRMEENDKSIESNNTFFRPVRQLQTTLLAANADGSSSINDGALICFDENSNNEVDKADMKKLDNFTENISVWNKNTMLCIEKRKPVAAGDTIFYTISKLRQKKYQLQFAFAQARFANGTAPLLEDIFVKKQTPLNLDNTTLYDFTVSADTASSAAGRFRIVFKQVNKFVQFKAVLMNEDVQLQWNVTDTAGIISFEVQRSTDSINFSSLVTTDSDTYNATDNRPVPGMYFYRIKCISNKGVVSYSHIQKVVIADNNSSIFVYPNPVTEHRFTLVIKDAAAGIYVLRLLNAAGKLVLNKNLQHAGGRLRQSVTLPSVISNGIYLLEVNMPVKKQQTLKVFIQQQ